MIVFTSRTGNIKHIIGELNLPSSELTEGLVVGNPYFLFTYTDGLGEIPEKVEKFLTVNENKINLRGIIVSGNINFGAYFCKPAELISEKYNIPIVRKIDLRGTNEDIAAIKEQYNNILRVNK